MFHYIISPVLEMRKSADCNSEVVSQALFSENVEILEEKEGWVNIKTLVDNYTGWVKKGGICSRKTPFIHPSYSTSAVTTRLATHLYEDPDTIYGPILTLPFESRLSAIDWKADESRWLTVELPDARKAYVQRGDITTLIPKMNPKEICRFSQSFLGLPYTWGGRSSFGYDCSGFVQMLYRQMGLYLPRDSKDQFGFSAFVDCQVADLAPADLIFFGHSKDRIAHVGLALGEGGFIHTSAVAENKPYLRISHIDDKAWNGSGYYPFVAGKQVLGWHG